MSSGYGDRVCLYILVSRSRMFQRSRFHHTISKESSKARGNRNLNAEHRIPQRTGASSILLRRRLVWSTVIRRFTLFSFLLRHMSLLSWFRGESRVDTMARRSCRCEEAEGGRFGSSWIVVVLASMTSWLLTKGALAEEWKAGEGSR